MAAFGGGRPEEVGEYLVNNYDIIGYGAFGVVTTGTNKGETIAAKKISLVEERKARKISEELDRLKTLKHPNIVEIFDIYRYNSVLWIMMEYCRFKTLKQFFEKVKENIQEQVTIMLQIAQGIQYLHSKDIVHRDIKPENIIVAQEKPVVVKLIDFDVSKFLDPDYETSCMSSDVGTPAFKAPEYFQRFKKGDKVHIAYHRNVDIFAAGLTFLAMIQGNERLVPRIETGEDESEMFQTIGQLIHERRKLNKKNLEIIRNNTSESDLTQNIRELIREMTRAEPSDRADANEVVRKLEMTQAEPKDHVGATDIVGKFEILKPLFIKFLVTMDTKTVSWPFTRYILMETGHIVVWGKSSLQSPAALHIFPEGLEDLEKVRVVKGFCKPDKGVFLEPVKVKNQEFLAVSCAECHKIRLYDMNSEEVTTAFYNSSYYPGRMSAGEEGVLYVINSVYGDKPILKLNTQQIPFTGPHEIIQSGMKTLCRMIHIPSPHNLLVFSHHKYAIIRAVSTITREENWKSTGEVDWSECDPRGMFFSQDHQALLVADGWNRRILVVNPMVGLVKQSIQLNEVGGIVNNLFVHRQKLIVGHIMKRNYKVSVFAIE